MSLESDVRLMSRVPILSEFSEDKLRLLAFSAENRVYRDGQRLFSAGDRADSGFVLASGQVALFATGDGVEPVEVYGEGTLLGGLSMIVDGERNFTAIALGEVAAIQIRRPLFRRMLDEYPDIAQRLHAQFAAELAATTRALLGVKSRFDDLDD